MSRPIGELKQESKKVLELEGEFRKKIIQIAKENNPAAVWSMTVATAINHGFAPSEADVLARANRFLAILRRDYGNEEFLKTIR